MVRNRSKRADFEVGAAILGALLVSRHAHAFTYRVPAALDVILNPPAVIRIMDW